VTLVAARPDAAEAVPTAAPSAIRVENVAKTFAGRRGRVRALEAVSFDVPAGQFV
jgi:ABC-type glutathione transport system ATPase component